MRLALARRYFEEGSFDRALDHYFEVLEILPGTDVDMLELNEALDRLALLDERKARVVELKFFGGQEMEEVARCLDVSKPTVERDWRMARAWLHRELTGPSPEVS